MDKLNHYRQLIRDILMEYTRIPYKHGDIKFETVFDSESDRYLLIILGRQNKKYHHGCLIHIDIIDSKQSRLISYNFIRPLQSTWHCWGSGSVLGKTG